MMDAFELTCLAQLLLGSCREKRVVAVEIGAFVEKTTAFCLDVLKQAGIQPHWICIDPFEFFEDADPLNPQGVSAQFIANVKLSGMARFVSAIMTTSQRAVSLIPPELDFLIIDRFHSYDACAFDVQNYGPRVRPGGGMFVDDYGPAYPEVVLAVAEFLQGRTDFTIVYKRWFVGASRSIL